VLSQHSHIILDCEGRTLGAAGGKLSLLNLGVSQEDDDGDEHLSIFVIDVLAFQKNKAVHLAPIFDILKSEDIFKVVFDGRMDSSELLHGHGVKLNNVLGLQLADVLSREKRGEGAER
jgi:exonuclease 3'-5' domain-containing protein 1